MATYGNIPKIPKYHEQNLPGPDLQGLPHSLESQGCAAWLPATTAMKVGQTWKKQRGKQRSSKMFQDVSTVTKRCWISGHLFQMNFRRSLLHVSYDLTKSGKHGKRRSMSPFSKPHGCGSPGTTDIPWIYPQNVIFCSCTQNCKKNPLVNMVSKIGHLVWSIFPLKPSFGGIFQPTFDFPIFGIIFSTEAMTGR